MKYPGRPERVWLAVVSLLAVSGLACLAIGIYFGQETVLSVGWWLGVCAIGLASIPLCLLVVMLVVEKLRS
jgi:hypothetical protein